MKRNEHTQVTWEMDAEVAETLEGVVTAVHDWVYSADRDAWTCLVDRLKLVSDEDRRGSLAEIMRYLVPREHFELWRRRFASNEALGTEEA